MPKEIKSQLSLLQLQMHAKIDELGVTKSGVALDGTPFFPFTMVEGHPSRMGEAFLK